MAHRTVRIPLNVPDIGDAESIELVQWNASAGESVREGQELCELVTDKAAFPLESPHDGVLVEIHVPEGASVHVGDTLAILETTGSD